jgi:peptide/nickel transport system permease protein
MKEQIRKQLGLDVPIWIQYGRWVSGVFRGDLGMMMWADVPVSEELGARLPVTVELGLMALATSLLISLPIGVYSAIRQDTVGDYVARSFAILCIALPGFWIGTMVVVLPARYLGWTPPEIYVPFAKDPADNLLHIQIPGVITGMASAGINMRMTRTMMLEVLRQDYIRTAWSKGLGERVIIVRHALKNAFIPVITIIGLQVPVVVSGTVIIEQIFSLPGIGRMLVNATFERDYTTLSGITFVIAIFILFVNLLIDLTYAYLDPRLKYT